MAINDCASTLFESDITLSPEELAALHPRLFHITRPTVVPSIRANGLLSTNHLLTLFAVPSEERHVLETTRRSTNVTIHHPKYGEATLTDNAPLSDTALLRCLDDGLQPSDWMRLLNQRVFFWVNEKDVEDHLRASTRRGEPRAVLVFDTLSLAKAYHVQIELAAINTGSTIRRPARRGLATFTPAHQYTYREWQRLRGHHDRVKELTVRDGIDDVDAYLVRHYAVPSLDESSSSTTLHI